MVSWVFWKLVERLVVYRGPPITPRRHSHADDYRELLRIGYTAGESTRVSTEDITTWRVHVAEPWFSEIRSRAARDGLDVEVYEGYDAALPEMAPAAHLLRPDGSRYPTFRYRMLRADRHDRRQEARRRAMMLDDWGDALVRARARAEIDQPGAF